MRLSCSPSGLNRTCPRVSGEASTQRCLSAPPTVQAGELPVVRPLAEGTPLTGRQPEFFNYQSPRRRTENSRGIATLQLQPMFETKEVRDLGPGAFLDTFVAGQKYPRARGWKPRRYQIEFTLAPRQKYGIIEKKSCSDVDISLSLFQKKGEPI